MKLLTLIDENKIVQLAGLRELARLPLSCEDSQAVIYFRHLIVNLLRKPGVFARYQCREQMFLSLVYRLAYDRLDRAWGDADKGYLGTLKLGAGESLAVVENALEQLLVTLRGMIATKNVRDILDT